MDSYTKQLIKKRFISIMLLIGIMSSFATIGAIDTAHSAVSFPYIPALILDDPDIQAEVGDEKLYVGYPMTDIGSSYIFVPNGSPVRFSVAKGSGDISIYTTTGEGINGTGNKISFSGYGIQASGGSGGIVYKLY